MAPTRLLLVALAAAAALLVTAPAASAVITVTCAHGGANTALDVTVSGTGDPVVLLKRSGLNVVVTDQTGGGSTAITCTGDSTPSVNDISSITVDDNATTPGDSALTLDQGGGAFAPGFEAEVNPEIEFGPVDLGAGNDFMNIVAPTGAVADTMRFGDAQAGVTDVPSWNLNNDADADGTTISVEQYNVHADTPNSAETNDDVITGDGTGGVGQGNYPEPLPLFINFFGHGGNDTLVAGKSGGLLVGADGNDTLTGGAGGDSGRPGPGNDSFNGGAATDTVSYFGSAAAVTVDLAITMQQNTIGAGLDTITNTEAMQGSVFADTLFGDENGNPLISDGDLSTPQDDILNGRGGNDGLFAGVGNDHMTGAQGNDSLSGGMGNDTLSYAQASTGPITISLSSAGAQPTGGAGTDTLLDSFENLTGSPFGGDMLTGNTLANFIDVRDGLGDTVTCLGPPPPPPADSVRADMLGVDSINADCETIDFLPAPPPPVTGATLPTITQPASAPRKKCKKGRKLKKGKCVKKRRRRR